MLTIFTRNVSAGVLLLLVTLSFSRLHAQDGELGEADPPAVDEEVLRGIAMEHIEDIINHLGFTESERDELRTRLVKVMVDDVIEEIDLIPLFDPKLEWYTSTLESTTALIKLADDPELNRRRMERILSVLESTEGRSFQTFIDSGADYQDVRVRQEFLMSMFDEARIVAARYFEGCSEIRMNRQRIDQYLGRLDYTAGSTEVVYPHKRTEVFDRHIARALLAIAIDEAYQIEHVGVMSSGFGFFLGARREWIPAQKSEEETREWYRNYLETFPAVPLINNPYANVHFRLFKPIWMYHSIGYETDPFSSVYDATDEETIAIEIHDYRDLLIR